MKSVNNATLSLLLFTIIALARADTVTILNKSAIDIPPENLRATSMFVSDEPSRSVSFNYSSIPPAITASGTNASVAQVAATLTFTGGGQDVVATSV